MSTGEVSGGVATPGQNSVRNWLIGATLFVAAAIVFGVLYLFVIAPSVPSGNVGWFLFSFATGLTMIIMPCTLPLAFVIVPLSMGKGLVRGLGMAVAFGLGIALTLSMYGIAAALLGGVAIDALGADLESIKNWVYFVAGTFAFLFALSEIGLLNVHMPTYTGAAPAFIQKRQEILKAFFLGLFLGNVGVGCPHPATPLILIEIASSGDVFYGWLMFLIHAIGRILPLLLLAFLAILGVNGLNWLMARKATLERVTGWAMVFVAGFILTLGLFSHDWWVNSGIHSALETLTQESKFNTLINDTLGTNVAHVHGLETGAGLFGLPLSWGSLFLVTVWLIPIWWWYFRKKHSMLNSPAFKLQALEADIDRLERDRRQIESMLNIDELETTHDLKHTQEEIDALEKKRREEEGKVQFGETGVYKEPLARSYEARILGIERNYLIAVSIFLILIFVHYLPTNFYYKNVGGGGDHHGSAPATPGANATAVLPGTPYETSTFGLPEASGLQFIELKDGDSYTITASYVKKEIGNRTLRMLAYNGSIPGPFIKVKEGSQITINFINNTDVDQTIHSHGVRLDNNFDGVPGVTQNTVKPKESFTYTVKFPDAGVAWYHPHTRDDYGQELGLYGNYLIDPINSDYWSTVNREVPLIIDDILVENNQIQNFYKEFTNHALLGRFGNEYLVNGSTEYSLDVSKNEVVRFQITNASNARTYRLSMPGASMKLVGGDLGKYELETFVDEVVVSPAERMIVEAYFTKSGKVKLQNRMKTKTVTLAEFDVDETEITENRGDSFNTARRDEGLSSEFSELRKYFDKTPDKKLKLTVALTGTVDHSAHAHAGGGTDTTTSGGHAHDMGAMDMNSPEHAAMMATMHRDPMDSIEWGEVPTTDAINTTKNVEWQLVDETTGKTNMKIPVADWTFTQGQLVKVRITNDMLAAHVMQHPIHLHGQRFVVLSENGVVNKNMVWKDTALVPPGQYIDILVDMSNLGEWMMHCHIVEHLFAGMMLPFRVQDQNGYATGDEFRKSLPTTKAPQVSGTPTDSSLMGSYSYTDTKTDVYNVRTNLQSVEPNVQTDLLLSFTDQNGNAVNLSDTAPVAVSIVFVNSDNSVKYRTYPGNTTFPAPIVPTKPAPTPSVPASDGHNHMHYLGVQTAYAHGDAADNHHAGTMGREYTVPVKFSVAGEYKGFVEFILEGETTPRVTTFALTVGKKKFSVDNYGWDSIILGKTSKWWILLLISLGLMVPIVLAVRKYINVK
jgi:suppressor of ftsI